jgi:hypothetical protein
MAHKWSEIRRTLSPELEEETRQYVKSAVASSEGANPPADSNNESAA